MAAQTGAALPVTGVVQDQTGAVLPGATVDLATSSGVVVQTTVTDGAGAFRFDKAPAGQYQVRARFEGFAAASIRVRVTNRPSGPLRLVLGIAGLSQEITVSNAGAEVGATASKNVDAVSIDTNMLESLPVFDNDYVATMSRFLDAGSLGNTGVTIVVNGLEVSGLNVSASAVQQIRINQDPYSAEYSRPGRGRVEILTKPGGQEYHGDVTLILRDGHLNAQNAFATTKPLDRRRIFEGFFGGPLGTSGKTSFMLSANASYLDQQAFVHAVGPEGTIEGTVPQPSARALVTGSITHQISEKNTFSIRPNYQVPRATRTAAPEARLSRALPPRSSITSSKSRTRSRRFCDRICSISSRSLSGTSANRRRAPRRLGASSWPGRSRAVARRPIFCGLKRT